MESLFTESALYGSKIECAKTDTVFLSISEVCDNTVSFSILYACIASPRVRFELFPGSGAPVESVLFDGTTVELPNDSQFDPSKPLKVKIAT